MKDEPRRFSSRPTTIGDFWHDADLEVLERDAAAASSPLVRHILMTNIEAERERRGDHPLPTITEALQESPADFAAGFSEEITIVTRRPDPMH